MGFFDYIVKQSSAYKRLQRQQRLDKLEVLNAVNRELRETHQIRFTISAKGDYHIVPMAKEDGHLAIRVERVR